MAVQKEVNILVRILPKGLRDFHKQWSKTNQQFKDSYTQQGKLNKRLKENRSVLGRMGAGIRKTTAGFRGFKMELLGVMFFGMMIANTFKGLIQSSLQMSGAMQLLSTVLGIMFLPLAMEVINFATWLLEKWNGLDEGTQKLINSFVKWIIIGGTILYIIGSLGLGIGALIIAFGGLIIPLAVIAALFIGVAALMGATWADAEGLNGELKAQVPGWDALIAKLSEWKAALQDTAAYGIMMEWWDVFTSFLSAKWGETLIAMKESDTFKWLYDKYLWFKTKWEKISKWWEEEGSQKFIDGWKAIGDWWEEEGEGMFDDFVNFFKDSFWPFFRDDLIPFFRNDLFPLFKEFIQYLNSNPLIAKMAISAAIGGKIGGGIGAAIGAGAALFGGLSDKIDTLKENISQFKGREQIPLPTEEVIGGGPTPDGAMNIYDPTNNAQQNTIISWLSTIADRLLAGSGTLSTGTSTVDATDRETPTTGVIL